MTAANDIKQTLNLVVQAKGGDDAALNLLLQRYQARILRIVRARLGPKLRSKMESMDVVQDVMIRALKGFDNFQAKDEAAFLRWVSRLVQNQISDLADYHGTGKRDANLEIRKNIGDSENFRSVTSQIPANSMYRPSVLLSLKEDFLRVEKALDTLPDQQREIVIMRQCEGFSFKDIGKEHGLSEDAARMQYSRALSILADLMNEDKDQDS